MVQRVPAKEFRDRLTELLGAVQYRNERLVVEKHGKPVAALVPIGDFELLQAERDAAFLRLLEELRAGSRERPAAEVLADIDAAVAEVRAERAKQAETGP